MIQKLGAVEAIKHLNGWTAKTDADAISKSFRFDDFKTAWSFMSACALKAEQADHHPEWQNVYNQVDVTLTTHDVGGVTERDVELASFMDAIAAKLM